jgi:hypothetical protein
MDGAKKNSVVFTYKLCFHCLKGNHRIRSCPNRKNQACAKNGCARYHHPALHSEGVTFFEDYDSDTGPIPEYDECEEFDSYYVAKPGAISLQTLVVKVQGCSGSITTMALLDSGSNTTLIDAQIASQINANVIESGVSRSVNYVDRKANFVSDRVQVSLISPPLCQSVLAWTVDEISNTGVVDWSKAKNQFDHLKQVPFPKLPQDPRLGMIIGTDHNFLFRPLKVIENHAEPNHPRATLTPLGWTCTGPSSAKGRVAYQSQSK